MKLISKFLTSIGVGIIGLISLIAILFSLLNERELASHSYGKPISYLKNFEARFYDYRMKSHLSEYPKNDDLVLVKIDDQSLQKIGSYPIPRDNYVTLLDNLKKYGAKVAAFDVLFPEKVMACGEDSPDDRVAQAISRFQSVQGNSVILAYSVQEDPGIPTDYLFDYDYLGRSEEQGLLSQQLIIAEGGFKSKLPQPFANQWITTLNTSATLWRYIMVYGDVGIIKNQNFHPKFVYDSGIRLNLVEDYFELYLPIYSNLGWEIGQPNYDQKIRFIVTLSPKTLLGLFTRRWY